MAVLEPLTRVAAQAKEGAIEEGSPAWEQMSAGAVLPCSLPLPNQLNRASWPWAACKHSQASVASSARGAQPCMHKQPIYAALPGYELLAGLHAPWAGSCRVLPSGLSRVRACRGQGAAQGGCSRQGSEAEEPQFLCRSCTPAPGQHPQEPGREGAQAAAAGRGAHPSSPPAPAGTADGCAQARPGE